MLAKQGNPSDIKYPVAIQHKLDGIRAMVVDGKLLSRTLKPIPNLQIRAALAGPEFEGLDGELIVGDPTAAGCMQRTSSFVMAPNKTGEPWTFYVFDKWDEPGFFQSRHREVAGRVARYSGFGCPLISLSYSIANSASELGTLEAAAVEGGHEGIIIRALDAPYKFGRSGKFGPLLKIKRFIDFEAEVIGVYEEMYNSNTATTNALGRTERSTKKEGMIGKATLGGLILRAVNGPHAGQEFRCGSGFSKEQREELWLASDFYLGQYAKIKSFPIGVKDAPRFPVFLGWRDKRDFDE